MRSALRLTPFALALVAGCGGEGLSDTPDMTVVPDLTVAPDLVVSPDLAPVHSGIGDPCTGNGGFDQGTCNAGQSCIPDGQFGFTGGYCTAQCDMNNPCPTDAKCVAVGGNFSLCFVDCTMDSDCRQPDYRCSQMNKVCVPVNQGGNGGGVTPGTNNGAACVMPIHAPGDQAMDGPFGKNLQVSNTQGLQAEDWVAFDPNSKNLVIAFNDLSANGPLGATHSGDDGATWDPTQLIPPNKNVDKNQLASDPVVAVDKSGGFWVSWVGYDQGQGGNPSNMQIWVAHSGDGGVSFPDVFLVSPPGEWQNGGFLDKPWLAISPLDDTVALTWDRQTAQGTVDIREARSTDHGMTWSKPLTISDSNLRPNNDRNLSQIVFGSDGKLYSAWVEIQQEQFGATTNAVYLQVLAPDGSRMGGNVRVTAPPDSPTFEDPSVAVSGSNVYVGFISGTNKGDWDVRVSASLDGGASFTKSVKVNDDPTCATHFHHQIAVDGQGNVHAIWFDNRFLTGNVLYAKSAPAAMNTPLSFGKNVFANDAAFTFTTRRDMANWLGDYLGLITSSSEIYAAWTDNRNNNRAHIFFAKAPLQ